MNLSGHSKDIYIYIYIYKNKTKKTNSTKDVCCGPGFKFCPKEEQNNLSSSPFLHAIWLF